MEPLKARNPHRVFLVSAPQYKSHEKLTIDKWIDIYNIKLYIQSFEISKVKKREKKKKRFKRKNPQTEYKKHEKKKIKILI